MSTVENAAEKVTGVVADVAEKVGEESIDFAAAARQLSQLKVKYTTIGYVTGAITGAVIASRIAYSRAEAKYSQIADEEIAEAREHYQAKALAAEGEAQKGRLDEIVAEKGYVSNDDDNPPMAVTPPPQVVEAASEATEEDKKELRRERPEDTKESEVRNVFRDADESAQVLPSWNHQEELRRRTPDAPYVIHIDEKDEFEDYTDMSVTYYEGDDVLCNERNEIIPHPERDRLVGETNLNRFGHGTGDPSVVFVRNDPLEMIIEVVKSPGAYTEEVQGFEHTDYGRNLERMRQREREELDDG